MMGTIIQGQLFSEVEPETKRIVPNYKYYEEWLAKFDTPRTTDDCYTPKEVYCAVLEWLSERVHLEGKEIIRPFYPGGDYENAEYPKNCVVVDNPPFSIITKIVRWYASRDIPFFLFAPGLTLFQCLRGVDACGIVCACTIVYANGAKVNTGFVSNLFRGTRIIIAKSLKERIKKAQESKKATLPALKFCENVITSARLNKVVDAGDWCVPSDEAVWCSRVGKENKQLFGAGFLVSDRIAAQAAQAAQAAKMVVVYELSAEEKKIVEELNEKK